MTDAIQPQGLTTAMLTPAQLAEAVSRAAKATIKSQEQIPGLGAEVQRRLTELDYQLDKVQANDLSVVGDTLLDLEGGLSTLDAKAFLNNQPSGMEKFIDSVAFLRQWFGVMQRLVRGYQKALEIIEQRAAVTENHIVGLVDDTSSKSVIIEEYTKARDELLIWARVGEIKIDEVKANEDMVRNGPRTANTNIEIARLSIMRVTYEQRVAGLLGFANFVDQQALEMTLGSQAETLLINSMRSALEMQIAVWKSTTRKVISALRTRKAIEISRHNRATTERLLLQGSAIAMQTVTDAAAEAMNPIVAIGVLETVNKQFIDTVAQLREQLAVGEVSLKAYEARALSLMNERNAALADSKA